MGDSASINVGLQVLFKKCYLIKGEVKKGKICGENSNGNSVTLEKESCRALATNRKFFPYKNIENNNFAIFPYEIAKQSKVQGLGTNDLICKPLNHNSFSKKFPLAGKYLTNMKSLIQSEVVTNPGADWILYTREQNHVLQSLPKILIPSTSQDSSATVDVSGDFYQDNVRMNSVVIQNASAEQYKAIAAIINSQIYDCLAKITSESLDNGYIQLNKQFILPVPIPIKYVLERKSLVSALSKIYDEMNKLSNDYYIAEDRETKESLKSILIATEIKLNNLVNEKIYQLSSLDLSILRKYGTRSNIVYSIDQQQNSAVELDFIEDAEAV
jgi:hypothetical protein